MSIGIDAVGTQFAYVAGPMRGFRDYNFPAFFAAEQVLLDLGIAVFNPARNDVSHHHEDLGPLMREDPSGHLAGVWLMENPQDFDLRNALAEDLEFITRSADMLVVLDGWEDSKGARAEVHTAHALGIPVYTLDEVSGTPLMTAVGDHDPAVEGWTQAFEVREHPSILDNGASSTPPPWPLLDRSPAFEETQDEINERLGTEGGGEREFRTVSATGGEKGQKLAAFDQISPEIERLIAEHFGKGARKYSAHNFRKGYPWSLSYSALRRHLGDFWRGEDYDNHLPTCPADCVEHTESLHIVAVIWHAMVLTEFYLHRKEYDDRYVYPTNTDLFWGFEATTPPTE